MYIYIYIYTYIYILSYIRTWLYHMLCCAAERGGDGGDGRVPVGQRADPRPGARVHPAAEQETEEEGVAVQQIPHR